MSTAAGGGLPRLRKARADVKQAIDDRIAKGEEIRNAPIHDEESYEQTSRAFQTWDDWNETYLRGAFDAAEIADEYASNVGVERIVDSLEDAVANLDGRLARRLTRLESIQERLELFEEFDEAVGARAEQGRPPRAERDPPKPRTVFVLMPFDAEFNWLYEMIQEACDDASVGVARADDVFAAGIVIDQVKEKIADADAVIAVCIVGSSNDRIHVDMFVAALGKVYVGWAIGVNGPPLNAGDLSRAMKRPTSEGIRREFLDSDDWARHFFGWLAYGYFQTLPIEAAWYHEQEPGGTVEDIELGEVGWFIGRDLMWGTARFNPNPGVQGLQARDLGDRIWQSLYSGSCADWEDYGKPSTSAW
ncbi:MAG: hypothetical protein DCC49_12960 [Acidobacteria bacterium]|nr:MAG: hypothetical protein DCC49_12960 [Acidobacteriota bacterium]